MEHLNKDWLSGVLKKYENQPRDDMQWSKVVSVNQDGSFMVALDTSGTLTRCANGCSAAQGDLVYVITTRDGNVSAIARRGGEPKGDGGAVLPEVSDSDNGKVLMVVNGQWLASKLPTYAGSYSVTPTADGLTVPTAGSYMEQDVTVNPVPYSETSNTAGGTTIYVASEVE